MNHAKIKHFLKDNVFSSGKLSDQIINGIEFRILDFASICLLRFSLSNCIVFFSFLLVKAAAVSKLPIPTPTRHRGTEMRKPLCSHSMSKK